MKSQSHSRLHRHLSVLVLLISSYKISTAQSVSSYEVPVDARSVAMGESVVAAGGNFHALLYNPAALAGLQGASASYAQRGMNWHEWTKDIKYHAWNASVATSFAVFGFSYNRLSFGEVESRDENNNLLGISSAYEHTLALGASHSFDNGLSVGISTKTWNYVIGTASDEKTLPILFDLGALYQVSFLDGVSLRDNLSFGTSLQNFGSNMIVKDNNGRQISSDQLDRYLRIGAAYSISATQSETELAPLEGTVSIEYRKLLNSYSSAQSDFYGFGLEARVFEIVAMRVGGYLANIQWIFGEPKKIALRYGAGLNIPFAKIGVAVPLILSIDYAAIPLVNPAPGLFGTSINTPLSAFTVGVQYEAGIF